METLVGKNDLCISNKDVLSFLSSEYTLKEISRSLLSGISL